MIDWFERVDPDRPFLETSETAWTYGEVTTELGRRVTGQVTTIRPGLDADAVFDCLAAITGSGAVIVGPGTKAPNQPNLGNASLVVFTSGTTGPPKGARLTRVNLEAAAQASMQHLGHGQDDTWLLAMPLSHVAGLSILIRSAYAGGSVRLLPGFDPEGFGVALQKVTMVSVVPTMLHHILSHDPGPFQGLRAVLVGGGPIPRGLLERASAAGLPVLPTYGMTETFGQVATLKPGSALAHRAHPLPGIDLRIEPDGRIAVRGNQVSAGYLGEPDRGDEWLITNDLGEIDDDGAVKVLGRADTVIATGGEKVDPGRVEAVLQEHPEVDDVLVLGVPDPEWGMAVACLFVGQVTGDDLDSWLKTRMPGFMVPRQWRGVEAIPMTPQGVPDRSEGRVLLSEQEPS